MDWSILVILRRLIFLRHCMLNLSKQFPRYYVLCNSTTFLHQFRGRTYGQIKSRLACHHPLDRDSDTFNDTKQHCTSNSRITSSPKSAPGCQGTTGKEARPNSIVRVFLFPDRLDRAIESGEKAAPNAEIAAGSM